MVDSRNTERHNFDYVSPGLLTFICMDIVDLSHSLESHVQVYPGDPACTITPFASVTKDGCSVHQLTLGSHAGTHIDAPSHFFTDGKSIDQIPLASLFGPFVLIDLTHLNLSDRQIITWSDIAASAEAERISDGVILVIRTGWSKHWGTPRYYEHPFLERDVAQKILERGVRVLAVDTLSPDETPYEGRGGDTGFGVHEAILGAGAVIAENLTNLEALNGSNTIAIVPLNLKSCDGSPARIVAWRG